MQFSEWPNFRTILLRKPSRDFPFVTRYAHKASSITRSLISSVTIKSLLFADLENAFSNSRTWTLLIYSTNNCNMYMHVSSWINNVNIDICNTLTLICSQNFSLRSRIKVTMDYATEENVMEISPSENQFYDAIIPSWHGEFCDNVPNHLFCQFQRRTKMKTIDTGTVNHTLFWATHC